MKKVFVLSAKIFSLISIYLCLILFLAACGGGGGGGASLPDSEYTTHNTGGWGGGGNNGGSGGGYNPIQGGTPLVVTGYSYGGQSYSTVEQLIEAINTDAFPTGTSYVDFTCTTANGTETRQAKVTKSASGNQIEHQYKATYTVNGTEQSVPYYKNDGISLNLPAPDSSQYTEENGVLYHATGWVVNGQAYTGGTLPVAPDSGDLNLGTIQGGALDYTYGFKTSGELVVNSTTGTITIDNTGRTEPISKIILPNPGNVSLDLSNVTNLSLQGTAYNDPAVTNVFSLSSIIMPTTSYSLGNYAFSGWQNLQSIDLSNCTSLGEGALYQCMGLSSVTLGSNITTIPDKTFYLCNSLTGIDLSNISSIGEEAFYYCSDLDGTISIPDNTTIDTNAFQACTGIDSVTFGNNVSIGTNAFQNCSSLGSVTFGTSTEIGDYAFYSCIGLGSVNLSNCTSLGQSAFQQCSNLSSVTLGNSIITVTDYAFQSCGQLASIDLGSCTQIGSHAFGACYGLNAVDLSSCQTILEGAFYGCSSLSNVQFGDDISNIGTNAFYSATTANFNFTKSPGTISYGSTPFEYGVHATWDDGLQQYLFTWNGSSW